MNCACRSGNQAEFTSEMMIHFSGLRNIDHPGILVFRNVSVCLDCGASRFAIPEAELALLASRTATREGRPPLKAQDREFRIPTGITS
jgi:hypothetical protein